MVEVSDLSGEGGGRATRALVLHPDVRDAPAERGSARALEQRDPERALDEAVALAAALPRLEIVGAQVVRLARVHPGKLFGAGKVDEIRAIVQTDEIDLVLVDGPVSPVQQRNLERAWDTKVLDRTGLILEIFAERAQTREGELQVELAALSYQRTRLVRAWTHLERQRGGLGFVGGPGETQIEADRRAIDEQITRLRRRLDKVRRTRSLHRASRRKVPFPVVALVGYTNAGKSTLFNRLTGAQVMAQDMLFATLDPTMRGVELAGGRKVILSDTVGFISDLPTQLVAAFRATLEEVLEADLIVHVRDISHPETEQQAEDVKAILRDLGVADATPVLELWNKIDLLDPQDRAAIEAQAARREDVLTVSASDGTGVAQVEARIADALEEEKTERWLTLGFSDGRRRAWLHDQGIVTEERETADGFALHVRWSPRQEKRFREL